MALCSVPCPRRASRHDHEAGRGDKQQNHFGRVSPSAVSLSADQSKAVTRAVLASERQGGKEDCAVRS